MATVVIVHGAGSGGWLWRPVRELLRAAGHEVFTPTLTGVGDRAHLTKEPIDLDLHIQDVLAVLDYEDLRAVTLVGHSYGGMVIAGVADRAAERLAQVVYLDAFVPVPDQAMLDLFPPGVRQAFEQQAHPNAAGERLVPPLPYPHLGPIGAGGLPEAEVQRLLARRVPQPLATYAQPVRLTNPAVAALPHTYIHCTDKGPGDVLAPFAAQARTRGWRTYELPAGHFPMLTQPQALTDLLLQIV